MLREKVYGKPIPLKSSIFILTFKESSWRKMNRRSGPTDLLADYWCLPLKRNLKFTGAKS